MNKLFSLLIGSLFALSAVAAEELATAEEARAMLDRAVAALKADKVKALEAFNDSESKDFRYRGLYVFCTTPDGKFTAHPKLAEKTLKGQNIKDDKDVNGKEIGKEVLKAKEAKVTSINYMFRRPGGDRVVPREAFVTRVGDQICGTAYYKQRP